MTKPLKLTQPTTLYDPSLDHDSCGVSFIVHMRGVKSHDVVSKALLALSHLEHRGACGSEVTTGDGAGILVQIPHEFFLKECLKLKIKLPPSGKYGVGTILMPRDKAAQTRACRIFERITKKQGQEIIGWRDLPINATDIGFTAKKAMPIFRQVFIKQGGKGPLLPGKTEDAFERRLYLIRKTFENKISNSDIPGRELIYIPSLSCRTIVYKGMLISYQLPLFFPDLSDPQFKSALALVHSRFSTNTLPTWELAQPFRYLCHNGEINTLRGNRNWMKTREALLASPLFGDEIKNLLPIIRKGGSDSAALDNVFELLVMSGYSLPHAMMMMIPEAWHAHQTMSIEKKNFYNYHSCLMEPWDGPASIPFTDGHVIGAVLDRNGLRPSRYYITKDDLVIMASEVGVLDIPPENIVHKGRLMPGKMFLVDMDQGRIVEDEEIKSQIASQKPYGEWCRKQMIQIRDLPDPPSLPEPDHETVKMRQMLFGYSQEDITLLMKPMAINGEEPIGSMGNDAALAVLTERPQNLTSYFKQIFAQVTNPPFDALREELVTSVETKIGAEQNLLQPSEHNCHRIVLGSPVIDNDAMARLKALENKPYGGFQSKTIPILFEISKGVKGLRQSLENLFLKASRAINKGVNIIILSDRGLNEKWAPIPSLLATAGLHNYLVRRGERSKVGFVVEAGATREVHQFCLLIGYGAGAINPYLAFETLDDLLRDGMAEGLTRDQLINNYIKAAKKGILKVMSKMGISTIQSYRGAQIFEAVGLSKKFVDRYFTHTSSRVGGIGLEALYRETVIRHRRAFPYRRGSPAVLNFGGEYKWQRWGVHHLFNPDTVHLLQEACRSNNYALYKKYAQLINDQSKNLCTLRGLFKFKKGRPIPIEEVESVKDIVRHFKTGAMSYGSISQEAHETLAIAMNRIGGKSNTGEGGEDPARFIPDENGNLKRSAIKQVASARFGVTSEYLMNADEIQIKMAQGAKPGEGGQLPGNKVYPWIAKVRGSTPGVGLISPPPHHDIYSIEDLAQLIFDLKNANPDARINVKLVSEVGVGTVATGVAKAHADVVLISGYDGGTGASPLTSIKHAGIPWELGLAETQQALVTNGLRDRIVVEVDGQLKTGRDVVIAALLGAEEFGFATAPLIALGCIMMRACHLDTCPVGVATQNPELRKKFSGKPEHVINFLYFVAQEMREIMAELGFKTIDRMIGRSDKIEFNRSIAHWKAKGLDFSSLLASPNVKREIPRRSIRPQEHNLHKILDNKLIDLSQDAIKNQKPVKINLPIKNTDRTVGTMLGNVITKNYGALGLAEDTIQIQLTGSAGQSFGAFLPRGITLTLEGDTNDYVGKGLSGGKIIVYPPKNSSFVPEENILVGNVVLYGATSGEAYFRGVAGERFCVRNSGAHAVVEGVGDHGCEYMTGGRVVVLGKTGRNFAAGMSGGIAYVYNPNKTFEPNCNKEMVEIDSVLEDEDIEILKRLIQNHLQFTNSTPAKNIINNFDKTLRDFVKIMPVDYKKALVQIRKKMVEKGISEREAMYG